MMPTRNTIFASLLIVLYLLLPVQGLVHAGVVAEKSGTELASCSGSRCTPADTAPCSGVPASDCCDTPFCSCACHAPLMRQIRLAYAPIVLIFRPCEPRRTMPLVYQTIFVPPQNRV
jgi:hypothetical protein